MVVARLDRLSRDVHFIWGLMAEKVPFVVTAFGLDVDPFMLHIYAAVAQKERALITQRTKAALKGRVLAGKSLRKLTLETEKAIFDAYSSGTRRCSLRRRTACRGRRSRGRAALQGRAVGGGIMSPSGGGW